MSVQFSLSPSQVLLKLMLSLLELHKNLWQTPFKTAKPERRDLG